MTNMTMQNNSYSNIYKHIKNQSFYGNEENIWQKNSADFQKSVQLNKNTQNSHINIVNQQQQQLLGKKGSH